MLGASSLSPKATTLEAVLLGGNTAGGTAILAAVGSAALPGVAFEGDTDLGFYRVGANELGIAAAGALVSSFSATGLALASGRSLSLADTSAGGTRLSMTMTPSGAWGGDIAHLEGVGPNFSGGAVLNLKSNDADQSFLTMDNGSGDLFGFSQTGTFAMADGTRQTITSTQTTGTELAITATPGSARTAASGIVDVVADGTNWAANSFVMRLKNDDGDGDLGLLKLDASALRILVSAFRSIPRWNIEFDSAGEGGVFATRADIATAGANAWLFTGAASGELTASTATTQDFFHIAGNINQSVTAGYNILGIDWIETGVGSGAHRGIYVNAPTGFVGDAIHVALNTAMLAAFDHTGCLFLAETATPTARTNFGAIYTKNDNKLYFQDGAGNEREVSLVP